MPEILEIRNDDRKIHSIESCDHPDFFHFEVGHPGVTSIEPYTENGEMAPVTWFAVYSDDLIVYRIPARVCMVHYNSKVW
jgi:hypothetical protein